MSMLRTLLAVCAGCALLYGCGQDQAGSPTADRPAAEHPNVSSKDFGDYVLHFNSMTTDQLQPSVASEYGIVRSKYRALLTVSIVQKRDGTPGIPVAGSVIATASNLTGQRKSLIVREIQDGEAFYYIGDVPVADSETLVFDLEVTPVNSSDSMAVRFSRQYFAD